MQEVAPGIRLVNGWFGHLLNAYLVGDVLIDGLTRWHRRSVLRRLHGHTVAQVALTHCHPDHQGVAWYVCRKYGASLACHEADVPAMEGRGPVLPRTFIVNRLGRFIAGPAYKVSRPLRHGDMVGDFRVVHAPGHTPGHVIYFREADRVAIAGDVMANVNFLTFQPGLVLPPPFFCSDPAQNRASVELLANLNPSVVCFGHGPPLRHVEQLHQFVDRMRRRFAATDNQSAGQAASDQKLATDEHG